MAMKMPHSSFAKNDRTDTPLTPYRVGLDDMGRAKLVYCCKVGQARQNQSMEDAQRELQTDKKADTV
jgi:hypothetical protein